ncbi:hypothetical protein HN011_005164 [Eciton burchellii]|nr:hypothetical protein HN011_005164 [Eciton burchellii]
MNSNGIKLLKKPDPYSQAVRCQIRCQKCLEIGHWSYECKGKRKYLHRSSRTSQLKKALQKQQDNSKHILETQNKGTKKNHVRKKMRKEESSSSSDSSSSSSESSKDSSSSKTSSSSSSSDSESDSSDSVSSSSSSSSSSSNNCL